MPCYKPLSAYRQADGSVTVVERGDVVSTMQLACGRCVGCRIDYAASWEVRMMHESQSHEQNGVITLTYDPGNLPADGSLMYPDFQLFMRKLRKHFKPRKIRFFVAGEYGDALGRPHFHAALFNCAFLEDRKLLRRGDFGAAYTSVTLEKLWSHGLSEVSDLTPQYANYVARYITKKITGDKADEHYRTLNMDTGELTWKVAEFCHMSLKPGIGAEWFKRYHGDVYPRDQVIARGARKRVPRYYDKLYKRINPADLEEIKESRSSRARERYLDNTDERLAVRETVAKARLRYFKRGLK